MSTDNPEIVPIAGGTLPAIMKKAVDAVRGFANQKRVEAEEAETIFQREEAVLKQCHNFRNVEDLAKSNLAELRKQLAAARLSPEAAASLGWQHMYAGPGAFDVRTKNLDACLKQMLLERFSDLIIAAFERDEVKRHAVARAEFEAENKAVLRKYGAL